MAEEQTEITNRLKLQEAYQCISQKYNMEFDVLKNEQMESLQNILDGNDCLTVLPTGFGKSATYYLLPLLKDELFPSKQHTAIIISPTISLITQQTEKLRKANMTVEAIYGAVKQSTSLRFMEGNAQVIFITPEKAVDATWMNHLITHYKNHCVVVAFDEAHCISEWGLTFRSVYRDVGDLVVRLNAPVLALTATITKHMQKDIFNTLHLDIDDCAIVAELPDRPEIQLNVQTVAHSLKHLNFIIDNIKENTVKDIPKMVVFADDIKEIQRLYIWAHEKLSGSELYDGDRCAENRIVEMFHAKLDEETKERVMSGIGENGKVKLLFATIAFGLGIDIKDIDIVVVWGVHNFIQMFQEIGRCARGDGKSGIAHVFLTGKTLAKCHDPAVLQMAQSLKSNDKRCVRSIILEKFALEGMSTNVLDKIDQKSQCNGLCQQSCHCDMCKCCNVCQSQCTCPQALQYALNALNM